MARDRGARPPDDPLLTLRQDVAARLPPTIRECVRARTAGGTLAGAGIVPAVPQINRTAAAPPCRRAAFATAHTRTPARSCVRFNGHMDLNQIPSSAHGHDFNSGQSRVVMVRKTEQRTFQVPQGDEEKPVFEKVTRETVQTFNGQRVQKTTTQRRAVFTDSDKQGHMKKDVFIEHRQEVVGVSGSGEKFGDSESTGRRSSSGPRPGSSAGGRHSSASAGSGKGSGPGANKETRSHSYQGPSTQARPKRKGASPGRRDDSGADYSNFAEECLLAHNNYRSKHNVPSLKLNKKLCHYSEEWAKRLASSGQMQHRPNSDYGENLFCVWSSDPNHKVTGNEPVDNWYAEIKDFMFGQEPRDLRAGHFTQVVWKDSKQLGVGLAKSKNGQTFVVCNYDPPGNFIGNFANQVPPVGSDDRNQNDEKSSDKGNTPSSNKNDKDGSSANTGVQPKNKKDTKEDDSQENKGDDNKSIRQSDTVLQNECIDIHNTFRAKHGCPPLSHDADLSKYATEWANTLIKENKFAHRPNNKYGENIFCHWTNDVSTAEKIGAKEAVNAWYSEIKDFRFGEEPKSLKAGHFTQVIWKNSKRVGIGRARDGKGRVIIVANYDPRGNYVGQFSNNCPPKKS